MSQNVSRVSMQQALDFGYSAWTPGPDPDNGNQGPGVWSPYYAFPFAADFINGATDLKVVPVLQQEKLVA
ncbi:glycoside hydrolase family 79 protein [Penicillium waksmanii]|uniref:glycoside hydrolase family 79 protein n=1 Tax=Penicillium waksmanii TaxID=69791 RepID=UPI002547A554|nr:glycoside hydrolase family 79 protein [Penicillium waksmanii]KAJ5965303.1 glycoside hydrolase family 79 protein [Penicillium waksmanii]